MCLGASFCNQVTLVVEGKFVKAYQELKATQCLYVQIFSWVNYSFLVLRSFFLLKKSSQVIGLACNCFSLGCLAELLLNQAIPLVFVDLFYEDPIHRHTYICIGCVSSLQHFYNTEGASGLVH